MESTILILLAEDEPLIGLSLQDVLEHGGFSVQHVLTGAEAMAAVEGQAAAISGVITDIQLGGGADGWEVARRARELRPHIPIVYMSGDSAHEHSAHGVPDSIMLQKPFAPAQVVTAISTLLNSAPVTAPDPQ